LAVPKGLPFGLHYEEKNRLNPTLIRAVVIVTFALLFYSVAVLTEQRKSVISKQVLLFLTAGLSFDIASTALMIAGSRNIPLTVHGILGYTALSVMLIDTILIWRYWAKNRSSRVPRRLHIYTRIAYGWWVIAYVAGAIIAMTLQG
jgi:uncharacterized repeat protein (TIGR03987 family)